MWWLRALSGLALMGAVAACGFAPMYGKAERTAVADDLATVWIETIEDRVGQMVHNQLSTNFNPRRVTIQARYRLKVTLGESVESFAKRRDETATRANLRLLGAYTLTEVGTGRAVFSGQALAVVSYNLVDADYAVITSRENARNRAARDVAEDITTIVSSFFLRRAEAAKGGT